MVQGPFFAACTPAPKIEQRLKSNLLKSGLNPVLIFAHQTFMKQPARNQPSGNRQSTYVKSAGARPGAASRAKQPARRGFLPEEKVLPLGIKNYRLLLISLALVVVGFICMSGKEDLYSFTKITLSVIFILGGYGLAAYAILSAKPEVAPEPENDQPGA